MNRQPRVTEKTAAQVLRHHFGKAPTSMKQIHGGRVNFVFQAKVCRESFIVRISDQPDKLQVYLKEQWATARAREKGIPSPEILEVSNELIELPYMIVRKSDGFPIDGSHDRRDVIREMAGYAAKIHSIPTHDFGSVFDWSRNRLSRQKSWKEFLRKEMGLRSRLDFFAGKKLLHPGNARKLARVLKEMESWKGKASLTHGDLRLKNLLLDGKGKICAILDWEDCTSNLGPAWEFSIALHDLSIEEKEAFLDGYGMKRAEYARMVPAIRCFNILNYYEVAADAARHRRTADLERIRSRLNGDLDLYAL